MSVAAKDLASQEHIQAEPSTRGLSDEAILRSLVRRPTKTQGKGKGKQKQKEKGKVKGSQKVLEESPSSASAAKVVKTKTNTKTKKDGEKKPSGNKPISIMKIYKNHPILAHSSLGTSFVQGQTAEETEKQLLEAQTWEQKDNAEDRMPKKRKNKRS